MNEWIDAQTPPDKSGSYLVAVDCPCGLWVEINTYNLRNGWENDAGYDIVDTNAYVKYWMKLPELPRKMVENEMVD